MRLLYKLSIVTLFTSSLFFTGCKDSYLDINDDPNRVTGSSITPGLIFPAAATGVGNRIASGNYRFINNWIGYWAASGSFAVDQTETTYNITNTFGDGIWANTYDNLADLAQIKDKALATGDSVYAGASIILASRLYQDLVDVFGNIPYSQAFQNDKFPLPTYDKGADVYNGLQKDLDFAISIMKRPAKSPSAFKVADIVNKGDQTRWIKFANTLKLRLLIRQSEMSGFSPASEIAKIVANGGVLQAGETVAVNPGYVNDIGKQSPYYANYGLTTAGVEAAPSVRANRYFVNLLVNNNDARLSRFFKAPSAGGAIAGAPYGIQISTLDGAHTSAIGVGLANSATQDQWIMPAFESLFLQAEAIARGWMTGDAKSVYEGAVKESFNWLGVTNATTQATTYLSSQTIANFDNAGATVASKAKFIAYQKYIALCGVDPIEAWSDLRRLNMLPDKGYLSLNTGSVATSIPVRLPYAQREYTVNAANVNNMGTVDIFKTKIFWQP
jgi:Starch-binding associating with outer membrane